jgi:hypothetical protein
VSNRIACLRSALGLRIQVIEKVDIFCHGAATMEAE